MPANHVLVAEDNPDLLPVLAEVLNEAGLQVLAASSGTEALRLLREHAASIRLAVLDVHMPAPSGLHLAVSMREDPNPVIRMIPVVLTTGGDLDELPRSFVVLQKPFEPESLIALARHPWKAARGWRQR